MKRDVLDRLRTGQRPLVLATVLDTGEQRFLPPGDPEAQRALERDQAATVDTPEGQTFIEVFNTPLRLIIVGAVHIAQPLSRLAALAGFAVTVVDPRAAFASEARFPGIELITEWPDDAIGRLGLDGRTAVVTLTHDPKLDDPALEAALRSPAFFVGCLGSQKTHASRLRRLADRGIADKDLQRLRGPVGLRIGARTPAEIGVSILAQMVQELRGGAKYPDPA